MKILLVPIGLALGYLLQILIRLRDRKEPGASNLSELIPYFKKHDIETVIDIIILIAIGGLWMNAEDIIKIDIPRNPWISFVVGFLAPEAWNRVVSVVGGWISGIGKKK